MIIRQLFTLLFNLKMKNQRILQQSQFQQSGQFQIQKQRGKQKQNNQLQQLEQKRKNEDDNQVSSQQKSYFSLSQDEERTSSKTGCGKKRGRRSKQALSSLYMQQMKHKKIAKIQEYEAALHKMRSSPKIFHNPFDEIKLNINREQILKICKQARNQRKDLRAAVRAVGLRHERNLFLCGVKQQLTYVIDYLQAGKIPRWMKDNFEDLLEKDFIKLRNKNATTYEIPFIF